MAGTSGTATGGELGGGWSYAVNNAHEAIFTKASGAALTAGVTETVSIAGFRNPTLYGTFYFRVVTYSTTTAANVDSVDFGAMAVSTAKSITTTADVTETLVFIVANNVNSSCSGQTDIADPNDTTEDLVQLSPSPMSLVSASVGTAQFCVATNAQHGYVVNYEDEGGYLANGTKGFWNGSHEFPAPVSQFASASDTEQFGFNLRDNTTPNVGSEPDGSGLVADLVNADYGTLDRFSYNDSGSPVVLAQKTAPSSSARYTLSYVANVNALTPAGTYQAHQIFICTATF
jgi:hypothetical protein